MFTPVLLLALGEQAGWIRETFGGRLADFATSALVELRRLCDADERPAVDEILEKVNREIETMIPEAARSRRAAQLMEACKVAWERVPLFPKRGIWRKCSTSPPLPSTTTS